MTKRAIPLHTHLFLGLSLMAPQLMADPVISEFLASNDSELADVDGDFSDWIEIHNPDVTPVNLLNWNLTDNATNPTKWTFPSISIPAGGYLIVFASNKGRTNPAAQLHTNFKLASGGEYLALVKPDGVTKVSEFNPYPTQNEDVSYGVDSQITLVESTTSLEYVLSAPALDAQGDAWTEHDFDDSAWTSGTAGLGYDTGNDYLPLINTSVPVGTENAWVRFPFTLSDSSTLAGLNLRLQYDDSFEAYLNGVLVASTVGAHESSGFVDFDISSHSSDLRDGENILAIRIINTGSGSSDLLLLPELTALENGNQSNYVYFSSPTPGVANQFGALNPGPIISAVTENPTPPADGESLLVTAAVQARSNNALGNVTLRYRVNFGGEIGLTMRDDGTSGDVTSGDGIYSALIPASSSGPGDMLRWTVIAEDIAARQSRMPLQADTSGKSQSPRYYGTVIEDPSITTTLPVFHRFVQNTFAMNTATGTRGSFFYDDRFYDNIFIRIRGNSSISYVKKSHKVDFNSGFSFHLSSDRPLVKEINLNTTFTDKSYNRAVLVSTMHRLSGLPSPDILHVYQRLNGNFYNVAHYAEQIDETFIKRHGIKSSGALYKGDFKTGPADMEDALGFSKKTRKTESNADLQTFASALKLPETAREQWLFDNVDIASMVNWWAGVVITQNIDASNKNYYFYRDTDGTGEWQVFPWDLDLSMGAKFLNSDTILFEQCDLTTTELIRCPSSPYVGARPFELHVDKYNKLLDVFAASPRIREMMRRRIRSLNDQFLESGWFADQLDSYVPQLQSAVNEDRAAWGSNVHFNWTGSGIYTLAQANNRIKNEYLTPRVGYLTVTHGGPETLNWSNGAGSAGIPLSQASTPDIIFGDIDYNPASGNQDEEYIELQNDSPTPVDLSGWTLSGGVTLTFKGGTVLPAGDSLYVSPNRKIFRQRTSAPTGGSALQIVGDYSGHLGNFGELLVLKNAENVIVSQLTTPSNPSLAQQHLVISQMHYNPVSNADAEFIEITNISTTATINLTGVHFSSGVDFSFTGGNVTSLAPGEMVLVVKNQSAFESVYGTSVSSRIAGVFGNATTLDNSGESIKLEDASNSTIHSFSYLPISPWPEAIGQSLVLVNPTSRPDHDLPTNWMLSASAEGSPAGASAQSEFDAWLTSRGQTDPLSDPDNDGWNEILTYSLGLDLAGDDFVFRSGIEEVNVEAVTNQYLTLETTVRNGMTPIIQISENINTWNDSVLGMNVILMLSNDNGDGTRTQKYRLATPIDDHDFMRLKVVF